MVPLLFRFGSNQAFSVDFSLSYFKAALDCFFLARIGACACIQGHTQASGGV
jgi:hypothetical protein